MTAPWDEREYGPYEDALFTLEHAKSFAFDQTMFSEPEFVEDGLKSLASDGPVAPWGRPGDLRAPPEPIPLAEMGIDDRLNVERSTWKTARHLWLDVRLIPVLEAPNLASFLAGLALPEAIEKYVAGDLLVECEGYAADPRAGILGALRKAGHFPIGLHPIDAGQQMHGAARASRPGDQRGRVATFGYYHRVAERLGRLVTALASGRIGATGLDSTRHRVLIDRRWWSRRGLKIDLANGDVLNQSGEVDWHSVEFADWTAVAPSQTISGATNSLKSDPEVIVRTTDQSPEAWQLRRAGTVKRPTDRNLSIEVLRALYPNGIPSGMRNDQIIEYVRERLKAEHGYAPGLPSDSTIEKAIARYRKKP